MRLPAHGSGSWWNHVESWSACWARSPGSALPDQEKAQSFVGSQTGEVGLESIDQFYASPSTLGGEDWYTSFTQRFYIAQNRPLGDLEHLGEILGRGFATVLQHQQHVQNSGGAHGGQFRNLTVDVWFRASC